MSELEGEGREDEPKVAPIVEIPGTEEARPELAVRKTDIRKRLGDSRFPGPGESVEPEHPFVLFIVRPVIKLGEDISPGPRHASFSIPTAVSSVCSMAHSLKKGKIRSVLFACYYTWANTRRMRLTISRQLLSKRSCCNDV